MNETAQDQLGGVLAGDRDAVRAFVRAVRPVVQARVARALRNNPRAWNRDPKEEVADLVQEVFVSLFDRDAQVLEKWSPEGGLSVLNFVGLVAFRRATNVLISRGAKWRAEPDEGARLEDNAGQSDPTAAIESRQLLGALVAALRTELSAVQFSLFEALILQERAIAELVDEFEMSANALYTHRSRLLARTRKILATLTEDPDADKGGE